MRSNSYKKQSKDNTQFLDTPRTNRRSLKEKEKLSEDIKAKYIQDLQERNRKLKYEILKINQMLEEQKEKPQAKKQHKLIPNESSSEVLKKQLDNVYKQINNYERQIRNLENKQSGGMITDKMSRLQNILKQKTSHLEKLKSELSVLTKTSLDNQKKLKNNAGKEQLENSMMKYNQEIKVLREKVREAENREKKKAENAKKQFDYIKRLERKLIQNGVAIDEIQELKKNNIFNQIYEKMKQGGERNYDNLQNSKAQKSRVQKEEPIEDMTVDRFMQLKNEINLYKKLQKDYDKRLDALEKEKSTQQKQTGSLKQKLQSKEQQIVTLQEEIGELKAKIKKANIKPVANVTKPEQQSVKQKPKMSPTKLKQPSSNTKSITDQTHIKYDQKGQATDKGQRFTDRTILGKGTEMKIVGVKVWTEKNSFAVNGIQCIYKIEDKIKEGPQHINKDAKKNCTQNVMDLPEGDYIKAVSGHLSQGNVIQYLVFISKNSMIGRFGMAKQTQKQFNYDIDEDEIPICMYGSVSNTKENKKDGSIIENLGFEICRDKSLNKDDKYI